MLVIPEEECPKEEDAASQGSEDYHLPPAYPYGRQQATSLGPQRAGRMGVYDHLMRPSMGHRMQVELRESQQDYHLHKSCLSERLGELRFDQRDLYTSPPPPSSSPPPSVQTWGQAGSRFSAAPDKAAHQARIAKLEQENTTLTLEALERESRAKESLLLPPIAASSKDGKDGKELKSSSPDKKSLRFGANTELKTPLEKAGKPKKVKGNKKTGSAAAAGAKSWRTGVSYGGLLPTIPDANGQRGTTWDSGRHHLHRPGKSLQLERSTVEEECRTFNLKTKVIPNNADPKRTEVRLPPAVKGAPDPLAKVTLRNVNLTGRRPKVGGDLTGRSLKEGGGGGGRGGMVTVIYSQSTPLHSARPLHQRALAVAPAPRVHDHFPRQGRQQLPPSLDDSSSSDVSDIHDEEEEEDQLRLPPLPVVRLSESKLSRHNFEQKTLHVPRLRLDNAHSPDVSIETGRSGATGATGATYLSQETLEWKGEYMVAGSRDHKNRMLTEILRTVRQRMRDNEDDLRSYGCDVGSDLDTSSVAGRSQVNFDNESVASGETINHSREQLQRLLNPGHKKHKVSSRPPGPKLPKLRSYLHKLSHKRRTADQRQLNRDRVRFQLAHNTIREMTQETLVGRRSSVQTATSTAA